MGIGEIESIDQAKIVADPKPPLSERRRLQNRIAQRKFRERRAQSRQFETEFTIDLWSGPPCDADAAGYPFELGGAECADDALGHTAGALYPLPELGMGGFAAYSVHSPEELDAQYPGYCAAPPVVFSPDASSTIPPSLPASLSPSNSSAALAALSSSYRTPTAPMTVPASSGVLTPLGDDDSSHRHPLHPCTLGGLPPTPALTPSPAAAAAAAAAAAYALDLDLLPPSSPPGSNPAGATPLLHVAAQSRNRSILASLLKHGYAADERDAATGRTALHVAAERGDEALVAMLLRYGADPHAVDARGQTPLFLAVAGGWGEVVEVLLEGGGKGGGGGFA